MPVYKTRCTACGHTWETVRGVQEGPPKRCPKCRKKAETVWDSVPAFHSRYSPLHPRVNRGRGH